MCDVSHTEKVQASFWIRVGTHIILFLFLQENVVGTFIVFEVPCPQHVFMEK